MAELWCPECGGDQFAKERVLGSDTGDLRCSNCGNIESREQLTVGFPDLTCKNPACRARFARRLTHLITAKQGFVEQLRLGFIRCPSCSGKHKAIGVEIRESGAGTGAYRGGFGEYLP